MRASGHIRRLVLIQYTAIEKYNPVADRTIQSKSKNIARQVLISCQFSKVLVDVVGVDGH